MLTKSLDINKRKRCRFSLEVKATATHLKKLELE
jgi:hypothetical protein